LRAECCGFAAIPFACLQIMQPSKLMTRVRFPSPAPTPVQVDMLEGGQIIPI
jgi:hypothetical protein